MKIIVCIKQVPALSEASMDKEKGVLVRTGENKLNPYDLPAIETALRLREALGGEVTALTMGPESAEQALRTALAMTADYACLMSDRACAGADVLMTARTLAQGIKALGGADLIICGQQTTDGDTAQVPFSLAEQLNIPVIGWVREIVSASEDRLEARQELTGRTCRVSGGLPLVLAVNPTICEARVPGLRAKLKAGKQAVQRLVLGDLEQQDSETYGLSGSPTRVVRLFQPETTAKNPVLELTDSQGAALLLDVWKSVKEAGK